MKTFFPQEINFNLQSPSLDRAHLLHFTQSAPMGEKWNEIVFHPIGSNSAKNSGEEEEEETTKQTGEQVIFPLRNIYNCFSKLSQNFQGHKAVSEEQQYRAPIMQETSKLQPTRTSSSVALQHLYIVAKSELAYAQYLPLTEPSFEHRLPLLVYVLVYHIIT